MHSGYRIEVKVIIVVMKQLKQLQESPEKIPKLQQPAFNEASSLSW